MLTNRVRKSKVKRLKKEKAKLLKMWNSGIRSMWLKEEIAQLNCEISELQKKI